MRKLNRTAVRALVAGGATMAMAAGTGAVVAPATAATPDTAYTCETLIGPQEFTAVADTNLPATIQYGAQRAVRYTATVTVPASLSELAYGLLGARSADGTGQVSLTLDGANVSFPVTIANAPVPPTGPLAVTSTGTAGTINANRIGTIDVVGGPFSAVLNFRNDAGDVLLPAETSCVVAGEQNPVIDSVNVVKATSTTATTLKPNQSKRRVAVKTVVKSRFGTAVEGKVRYVLKRNGVKVKTVTVKLSNGRAAGAFTNLRRSGTYTIQTTYLGSATLRQSKDLDRFNWRVLGS